MAESGFVKLDSRDRISLGSYTELLPGQYFRVRVLVDGSIVLTPVTAKGGM